MTKEKYQEKCSKLLKKAKKRGVRLDFNPKNFNPDRLNCLWYGGVVAYIIVSETLKIELMISGEVCAKLYGENGIELTSSKDKSNSGAFLKNMVWYLKNDKALRDAIADDRLIVDSNNWIEYNGIVLDKDTNKSCVIDLGMRVDNVLDETDILGAIDEALSSLEDIKQEIFIAMEEG